MIVAWRDLFPLFSTEKKTAESFPLNSGCFINTDPYVMVYMFMIYIYKYIYICMYIYGP